MITAVYPDPDQEGQFKHVELQSPIPFFRLMVTTTMKASLPTSKIDIEKVRTIVMVFQKDKEQLVLNGEVYSYSFLRYEVG